MRFLSGFVILTITCFLASCATSTEEEKDRTVKTEPKQTLSKLIDLEPGKGYEFEGNGKMIRDSKMDQIYTKSSIDEKFTTGLEPLTADILKSAHRSLKKNRSKTQFGNLEISRGLLKEGLEMFGDSVNLEDFDFFMLQGEDSIGNVHYTGYFTPVLQVSKVRDETFKYPLYKKPGNVVGRFPTREQIDFKGAFDGLQIELAYAQDLLDIYFMQVQGSGIVEFRDGSRSLFAYGGSNGHKYKSIGKYLVSRGELTAERVSLTAIKKYFLENPDSVATLLHYNPSYVFFNPVSGKVTGATGTELVAHQSIAVDPSLIPYGAILLGRVPVLNDRGKLSHHEYKLLVSQDTGGAIRGPGHVDLYFGIGNEGKKLASAMHHYGNLWLMLPKDKQVTQ